MSVADASLEPVTTTSRHQKRGFLLSLLTLLSLVGAFLGPPVDASASTRVAAETRVRAIDHPGPVLVGRVDAASSTGVGVSSVRLQQLVSATGVSTEAAARHAEVTTAMSPTTQRKNGGPGGGWWSLSGCQRSALHWQPCL